MLDRYKKLLSGTYFGSWTDEAAEKWAVGDAFAILDKFVAECRERAATKEELTALAFLKDRGTKGDILTRAFARAMNIPDQENRYGELHRIMGQLRRQFPLVGKGGAGGPALG